MKRLFTSAMALLLAIAPVFAQARNRFVTISDNSLNERFDSDQRHRNDTREVLDMSMVLNGRAATWFDGAQLITTMYIADESKLGVMRADIFSDDQKADRVFYPVKGQRVILPGGKDNKLSVERLGNYVMLIERDASGAVVDACYAINSGELKSGMYLTPIHSLLAGIYSVDDSKGHPVFGPQMPHYKELTYEQDPGIYALKVDAENHTFNILYGNGRVSDGDPSDPKWDKMPGGGGAGAIMGPMIWSVKPWVIGLEVDIVRDEPFVPHMPRIPEHALLSRLHGPYENVPGVWAVASVIPLTPQLLRFMPTEALNLMRNEILARHGRWFADPDVQMIFASQPWYKAAEETTKLTDIEDFNISAIDAELSRR